MFATSSEKVGCFYERKRKNYDNDTGHHRTEKCRRPHTHVKIDVELQQELVQPVLEKLANKKSKFRKDFEKGLTLEEVRNSAYHVVDQLFDASGKS